MNRQHNGQKKKYKQRSTKHTYKYKDRVTGTPLQTGGELRCSGRVRSSCSASGTRRINLVTNPVISREWGKDQEVFTSGTYPWSFVIQIFHSGQPSDGGDRKIFDKRFSLRRFNCDKLSNRKPSPSDDKTLHWLWTVGLKPLALRYSFVTQPRKSKFGIYVDMDILTPFSISLHYPASLQGVLGYFRASTNLYIYGYERHLLWTHNMITTHIQH
jgi:hypothetical protein